MHLVFFIRGIIPQVEILKTLMQCIFWKWKRLNLDTGRYEEILVQGALRPSILGSWEYIFPEECLSEVLCVLGITGGQYKKGRGKIEKLQLGVLRKILGCEKIDNKYFEEASKIPQTIMINNSNRGLTHCIIQGTALHCVGIKRDIRYDFDFSKEGMGRYNQEGL